MCGAPAGQTALAAEQSQFFNELAQNYQAVFGENQAILGELRASFEPILAAGPNQEGFSPQEKAALSTESIEATNAGNAKALQAFENTEGASGGGNSFAPSGAKSQIESEIANSTANEQAREQTGLNLADYEQGRQNYQFAAGVLGDEAAMLNSNAAAGAAVGAGTAAGNTWGAIAQEQDRWVNALISAAGGIAGAAVGGLDFSKPATYPGGMPPGTDMSWLGPGGSDL